MAANAVTSALDVGALPRALVRRRMTTPFELLIIAAWVTVGLWGLIALSTRHDTMAGIAGRDMTSMPGMQMPMTPATSSNALGAMPMWSVMVIAMMLPAALPAVTHVGLHSFRWRRGRAMSQYVLLAWLGWALFGVACFGTLSLTRVGRLDNQYVLATLLGLAAAWQLTPAKRAALRRCHRTVPLPATGAAAVAGVARFGWITTTACAASCWLMMLAMAAAPVGRMLMLMPVTTAVASTERLTARPRRTSRIGAGVLALSALACLL